MSDNLIIRAAHFACDRHCDQLRKYTNRPYIEHPMRVAGRLTLLTTDAEQIAAAWLHDTIEDCGVTLPGLAKEFGCAVATYVSELTDTSKLSHPSENRAARKKIDRDRLRGVSDAAKRIKLLDRIDNLGEMTNAPADFRRVYAAESRLLVGAVGGVWPNLDTELMNAILRLEAPSAE